MPPGGPFLPLTGGTVSGPVTLAGPSATLPGSTIQALHDALPANGGAIMLAANTTYVITATIAISKPNVHIYAPSWGTVLQRATSLTATPVLTAYSTACNHFLIENFTIDGNNVVQANCFDLEVGGDYSLIATCGVHQQPGQRRDRYGGLAQPCYRQHAHRLRSDPITEHGDGIFACFQQTCMIDHNVIYGFGTSAIMLDGDGSQCIGNRVWGNHTYSAGPGGQIGTFPLSSDPGGGRGVCIVGNTVGPGGAPGAHGIEVGGVDVLVAGNVIDTVNGYGMIVISDGVTVTGNRIRNSPRTDTAVDGISVFPNVSDFTITGNTIVDNRTPSIMRTGIWVQAGTSDRYTITGNTITGATFHPIFDGGSGDNKVIDNNAGMDNEFPTLIAAATMQFPPNPIISIVGTVTVTTITIANDAKGRFLTILTQSAMTFTAGATIANTITTIPGVPVLATFDGVQWYFCTMATASSTLPLMAGTAAIGTSAAYARSDHVHPSELAGNPVVIPSGQVSLNNATSNTINMSNHGFGPPTTTTRSIGSKVVLYDLLSPSDTGAAIGIQSDGIWFGTWSSGGIFSWYNGVTLAATLNNFGTFKTTGGLLSSNTFGVWNAPSPPGTKPVVTGAKGSNAALASLLTALAAYGLITDSTSA